MTWWMFSYIHVLFAFRMEEWGKIDCKFAVNLVFIASLMRLKLSFF